ncbi:biotin--[acetyl-CoA-carboxylase] ligase [Alkalihalobacterium chitinilyticum]|uniref:Bifunctional ligase/repressor BirA n=1 Tax=Alkalihalobacterium chitinilyticum TaxID=2980103 RepID=A0ABT5V8Y5_9BACI|nr:biotin--[acetyl-CoA-carboxylase] ligase [Alkalihalobacterium chitinilyticum]MDE5411896.1 biotin--[acetyl-CoA-carboxylase] ligase [Alkalihalobacterium chitinilyticum]
MKEKLLEMLSENESGFVSGEKISKHLGCSRTAIWKHIEELRKSGYEVEAVPRKGYRIKTRPNTISPHEIKVYLQTEKIGQELTYHESLPSTQEVAHRLAQEGAVEGHVVIADEQTSGKGRLGRVWHSPIGTSISMSIILRPKVSPQKAPQLTLLAAVAVVRGIEKTTGLQCSIKWPNDILLNGKKIVGILTEMQSEPDYVHSVIIGIGINVNHKREQFSSELREIATSLAIAKGEEVSRAKLMSSVFYELESLYEQYLLEGFDVIKPQWESYAISLGKRIVARTIQGTIEGVAKGITNDGVLLLEDDDQVVHQIYSADIEIK